MLNVAPQKERIPDHLRAMAEQDDKSAASGKTAILLGVNPLWTCSAALRRPKGHARTTDSASQMEGVPHAVHGRAHCLYHRWRHARSSQPANTYS